MQFSKTTKGMVWFRWGWRAAKADIVAAATIGHKTLHATTLASITRSGAPYEVRTRVPALRGRCPGPLDEGSVKALGCLLKPSRRRSQPMLLVGKTRAASIWSSRMRRRSEERRVGQEGVHTFRFRGSPYHVKKKTDK